MAASFNLKLAAESKTYCEEVLDTLTTHGLHLTELSTHLQGQLVAVHPAYDLMFDGFAPEEFRGNRKARQQWAVEQLLLAAKASANLGLKAHATFSGALAWPYVYPWPQRPAGLVETAFDELSARWLPILNAFEKWAWMYVSRSIPVKTCTTASPSRCSWSGSRIIRVQHVV